jgi:rfaE bifunctional protein nucleotidyltransferase chain/domain
MGQVMTLEQLQQALAQRRLQQPESVVVTTNGCFDLLHAGHVGYLQAARNLGSCLVVALNNDASVRGLKGDKRPIVGESERAALLAALTCVDYVYLFGEASPVESLVALQPDIHVKGGQYTEETLPEAPALKSVGTRLHFSAMHEGHSTSQLIETIVQRYGPEASG